MFGIVLSALNAALGFVLRGVIVKFVIMFGAWYLAFELITSIVDFVPSTNNITMAMAMFPPMLWYLLDLMRFDLGISLVLSAMAARFLIRRIPFVG